MLHKGCTTVTGDGARWQAEAVGRVSTLRTLADSYDKQLLAARMAVRLKQEYIVHLEKKDQVRPTP